MKNFKRKLRNFYLILKFIFGGSKPITQETAIARHTRERAYLKRLQMKQKYNLGQSYKKAPSIK